MNTKRFKLILVSAVCASLAITEANAQKPKASGTRNARTRPTSGYSSGYSSGYTTGNQAKDTTKKKNTTGNGYSSGYSSGYGQTGAAAGTAKPAINANVPVEVVTGGNQGGIGDSIRPSLRTDNAIDRQLVKDRTPLTYEHIREDDAVYKQRVWREIDTREKMNLPFRYAANEDNGNQRFINILYNAIQAGDVTVFNGEDDRFTTPLTKEQVSQTITGGNDTVPVMDMAGEIVKYQVRSKQVDPDSIYRYKVKEEWIFDKESSRMTVRILGVAPVMRKYTSSGVDIGDITLFWAYYPDLRPTLAKYEVYNGKNYAGRMTWEELFESRFFSSRITKSTIDNPFDQNLAGFIKDPLFRLLEGENIKDKIFNYEQDLWSY
jgi:gliding motility associated protien GldN